MAGGQQITASQGTLLADGGHGLAAQFSQGTLGVQISYALSAPSGTFIAGETGLVTANTDGQVALIGSASTVSIGTVAPSWGQSITGIAITSGIGTVLPVINPSTSAGQVITTGAGTVTPAGNNVTVNITGEEIESFTGVVMNGGQLLAGNAITSAAGTATPSNTCAITGIASSCAQGTIGVAQEADDTYITSSHGNALAAMDVAISGSAITSAAGSVGITGDVTTPLNGTESTSAAGSIGFDQSFPITGLQINSAQYNVGAPGGAALTGSESTVIAGTIFTTNDRDFALTGQQFTVGQGSAVTSYLAFVAGQELDIQQQEIGPRGVTLVGQQINSAQGNLFGPRRDKDAGSTTKGKKGKKPRVTVEIDGETFEVSTEEEAKALLQEVSELAQQTAKAAAAAAIDRFGRKSRADQLDGNPDRLNTPEVTAGEGDKSENLALRVQAELDKAYHDAQLELERAIQRKKQQILDEEESLVLMLLD